MKKENAIVLLTSLMTIFLIASNISSKKIIEFNDYIRLTAGFFTYPFVFLFAGVIIGIANKKIYFHSIFVSYISYLAFISLMIITEKIDGLESQEQLNESFKIIFNLNEYRIFFSSFLAYLVSMISFYYFYKYINGSLYKKILLSVLLSSILDVNIFLIISFFGEIKIYELFTLLLSATLKKILTQIILVPPTVKLIKMIKNEKNNSN